MAAETADAAIIVRLLKRGAEPNLHRTEFVDQTMDAAPLVGDRRGPIRGVCTLSCGGTGRIHCDETTRGVVLQIQDTWGN